ncbi:MAG TPA: hypothetical protein VFF11_04535, partial [Candidatus Binatia bacterium]|nr:hypothetical protein [Candidatus Binatia bacterium]
MKSETAQYDCKPAREMLTSEFLILPDGRVLAHSLSPMMAEVLKELNPTDETMSLRAGHQSLS